MKQLAILLLLTGCATTPIKKPQATGPVLFDREEKDVSEWTLSGPFPTRYERVPHVFTQSWEKPLETEVAQFSVRAMANEDLHCVAREFGKFWLVHHGYPPSALRQRILGQCGVTTHQVATLAHGGTKDASEEKLIALEAPNVTRMISSPASGVWNLGLWWGTDADDWVAFVVRAPVKIDVEPFPLTAADQHYRVAGKIDGPVESVRALINRGPRGIAPCQPTRGVAPPRYAFVCDALPDDESAWIEVISREPERSLSTVEQQLLVQPRGPLGRTWTRAAAGPESGAAPDEVAAAVNQFRQGLPPVAVSKARSELLARLTAEYFLAQRQNRKRDADTALEAAASPRAMGPVVADHVFTTSALSRLPTHTLVTELLALPKTREAILDPSISLIAAGRVEDEQGVGLMLGTWALCNASELPRYADSFEAQINQRRSAKGLEPMTFERVGEADAAPIQKQLADGSLKPLAGRDEVIRLARARYKGVQAAWYSVGYDPALLPVPEAFFTVEVKKTLLLPACVAPDEQGVWGVAMLMANP